jgi:hypothetical protein
MVVDDQVLRKSMANLLKLIGDLRPFYKKAMIFQLRSTSKNFAQGGRPTPWKPLSAVTIAMRKARRGKSKRGSMVGSMPGGLPGGAGSITGAKPLQDTRLLFASVTAPVARHAIREISPDKMVLGTRVPYAVDQQEGRKPEIVVVTIPAHVRRAHMRKGHKVREHRVREHTARMKIPGHVGRKFLLWLDSDLEGILRLLEDELERAWGKG